MNNNTQNLTPEEKLCRAIFGEPLQFLDRVKGVSFRQAMDKVLCTLPARPIVVLYLRFGFAGNHGRTFQEIAEIFGMSRERMRQIEAKSLRQLRHHTRTGILKPYLKEEK